MGIFSDRIVAHVVDKTRKDNEEVGKRKNKDFSVERFECAADGYSPFFVVCGFIFAVITAICVVALFRGSEDARIGIFFFGVVTVLIFFAGWATGHHRLIVEGNDVTYVNVWGIKKQFLFSEVTECLTTDQSLFLYMGKKKVVSLSKDAYGLNLLKARCQKDGVAVRGKSRGGITKLTLVWYATRTLALIFVWAAVGISVLMIPVRIFSVGFSLSDIVYVLKLDLILVGMFALFVLVFMLFFAYGLKEVRSIEKALGISFTEEMARRGAEGREYQDEEWFVESIPGKIEVLNRRFIRRWHGIREDNASGTTMYHVEFTDINGEVRKIGGSYKEYAEKMSKWYFKG